MRVCSGWVAGVGYEEQQQVAGHRLRLTEETAGRTRRSGQGATGCARCRSLVYAQSMSATQGRASAAWCGAAAGGGGCSAARLGLPPPSRCLGRPRAERCAEPGYNHIKRGGNFQLRLTEPTSILKVDPSALRSRDGDRYEDNNASKHQPSWRRSPLSWPRGAAACGRCRSF